MNTFMKVMRFLGTPERSREEWVYRLNLSLWFVMFTLVVITVLTIWGMV